MKYFWDSTTSLEMEIAFCSLLCFSRDQKWECLESRVTSHVSLANNRDNKTMKNNPSQHSLLWFLFNSSSCHHLHHFRQIDWYCFSGIRNNKSKGWMSSCSIYYSSILMMKTNVVYFWWYILFTTWNPDEYRERRGRQERRRQKKKKNDMTGKWNNERRT